MSNKAVKDFRRRRYSRLMSRMDADDDEGHWITTENGHKVHINAEGEPDIGNSHVLEAMNGSGSKKTGNSSAKTSASSSGAPQKKTGQTVPKIKNPDKKLKVDRFENNTVEGLYDGNGQEIAAHKVADCVSNFYGISNEEAKDGLRDGTYSLADAQRAIAWDAVKGMSREEKRPSYESLLKDYGISDAERHYPKDASSTTDNGISPELLGKLTKMSNSRSTSSELAKMEREVTSELDDMPKGSTIKIGELEVTKGDGGKWTLNDNGNEYNVRNSAAVMKELRYAAREQSQSTPARTTTEEAASKIIPDMKPSRHTMNGKELTFESLKESAKRGLSADERNNVIQGAMDLAFANPEHYFDIRDALYASGLAEQFEWEMGPDNTDFYREKVNPRMKSIKNDLKSQIPSPAKNKSSSAVFNGQRVTFSNVRNAGTNSSHQPRFIDISITDANTGERLGSFAENDYESAMKHVYRIVGLNTGDRR